VFRVAVSSRSQGLVPFNLLRTAAEEVGIEMKKLSGVLVGLCLFLGTACIAKAQENSAMGGHKPPKILVINREILKPGKAGAAHDRTESMFVSAMTAAKWPTHYLGMDSITGRSRSLFFTGYDSFEAWEKDNIATMKNATLSAALDRAAEADGALLDSYETGAFYYREDQSMNAEVDIPHYRYFEIEVFVVRPGHEAEWDEAVKLVKDAYAKALPDAHWAIYQEIFGATGGEYIVITPLKSAADIDTDFANNPKFMSAMGEDGMKKLSELSASAIQETMNNLFVFSPKKSYVDESWIKADPDFWKPKAMMPAKKAEEKKPQ
jgi:hypothetical protein